MNYEPLSTEILLKQGICCGNKCHHCPYLPRHSAGSQQVAPRYQRWIWFDFDGTLADSFQIQWEIFQDLAKKYGSKPLLQEKKEEYRNLSAKEFLQAMGIPWWRVVGLLKEGRERYFERIEEVRIFPGWAKVLSQLSQSYQLGIITSNSFEIAQTVLKRESIDHHFSFIQSNLNLWGKHRTFAQTLRRHQLFPLQVQYVGDEVRDVEAARKVGITCWAVNWGFNSPKRLLQAHPQGLLQQPKDLLEKAEKNR